jgi:NitT/TauT family transport system substrate-binding protein
MPRENDMRTILLTILMVCPFAVGCGDHGSSSSRSDGTFKTTIQLNWQPEPQFGGFYAAKEAGIFRKHGLDAQVVPGGVDTPTVQMVGVGKTVDFAVVSADELIISRSRGSDVVALFAVYQTNPQGLMTHAERGFTDIGDIFKNPGTVAMQEGLPYADFLKRKYGFDQVKIVPSPGGSLTVFQNDPDFTQQCFVTSEPLSAKKLGLDVKSFLIADAGYNPYTTVLVTRGEVWKKNPELVKKVVAAVREGWQTYLADPKPTNDAMQKLNPSMDAETFAASAEVQKPLIETEETKANGLGSMTRERWATLAKQLVELKVTDSAPAPGSLFVEVK